MDRLQFLIQQTRRTIEQRKKMAQHDDTIPPARQEKTLCPICKGTGYLRRDVPFTDPHFGKPIPCQCTQEQINQKKQQHLSNLAGLDSLERFRDASFDTYNPFLPGTREAYIQAIEFAAQPHGWLILIGGYGCGKTHLAVSIARQQITTQKLVMFQVVPRLLDYLRATFSASTEQGYDERFQQMCAIDLLILDDFGAQQNTAWANDKLFQLLNHRYNAHAPTVITMNTTSWETLEPRLRSRFQDTHLVRLVMMDQAEDYRICGNENGTFFSTGCATS